MKSLKQLGLGVLSFAVMLIGFVATMPSPWSVLWVVGFIILMSLISDKRVKKKPVNRRMAGHDFEYWCADYLRKHGYRDVQVTKASGDYGADITARDRWGNRWVFQCKYYGKSVSNSAVQEVIGAMRHYGANRAGVMTNSRLTKQARELAEENAVAIIEGLL